MPPIVQFRLTEFFMHSERPIDGSSLDELRRQALIEWWMQLELCGDCGSTSWRVLDPLRDAVTACLMFSPPQLNQAEHLTARAIRLVTGDEKS